MVNRFLRVVLLITAMMMAISQVSMSTMTPNTITMIMTNITMIMMIITVSLNLTQWTTLIRKNTMIAIIIT